MTVLFVCSANTCRSPMAEAIFARYLSENGYCDVEVESAGLYKGGEYINDNAVAVLKKHGFDISSFKPKEIDQKTFDGAHLIVTMTCKHADILRSRFGDSDKIICICKLHGNDIQDPYGLGIDEYERTYREIENACPKVAEYMQK